MSQAETINSTPIAPVPVESGQYQASPAKSFQNAAEGFTTGLLSRWTCMIAFCGLLAALILPSTGLGLPMCYVKMTTGLPCPGCGLTRSVTSAMHGKWLLAWEYNPFGFGFALFFAAIGPLVFLPGRARIKLQNLLRPFDGAALFVLIVFIALFVVHGIARIFLVQTHAPGYEWWTSARELPPATWESPK